MNTNGVTIVGAGLAGYTLAKELRKLAPDLPIALVTADSGALYSKPMLSNALAQGHSPEALVQAPAAEQATKLNIDSHPNCRVLAIRTDEMALETDAGLLPYGRLVLALGARPRSLGIPGGDLALSVNHLDDYASFRSRLETGAHVCILGAGLVGCEFANDLAASGYRVSLVETEARPLGRVLPAALSSRLQDSLSALGVQWHCGTGVTRVAATPSGYRVDLNDGESLQADLVLSAIGLEPETALARDAGLAVGRGIIVDRHLATDAPHIHALGDCAEVGGLILPYVLPLMNQARILAANLTGGATGLTLPALPVAVKTPACPLVVCPPPPDSGGHWNPERDDADGACYHFLGEDGSLLGFALAGDACGQRRQLAARVPPLLA